MPVSLTPRAARDPGLFVSPALSVFDAVAVCRRPEGGGPPVTVALAADKRAARQLVADGARAGRAAELAAELVAARVEIRRLAGALAAAEADRRALAEQLEAERHTVAGLKALMAAQVSALGTVGGGEYAPAVEQSAIAASRPRPRRVAARDTPDYRTAAEIWREGGIPQRAGRAARKKSKGPQSVAVTFADGIVMRVSTYLEGQPGLNEAAQFCRATRQAPPADERVHYPVGILYDHVAEKLGCKIDENEGVFTWIGSQEDDAYQSTNLQAVVMEMCHAHKIGFFDAMRDAQAESQAWADATRVPGEWVRDGKGCWRFIDIRPCPDVTGAEFVQEG